MSHIRTQTADAVANLTRLLWSAADGQGSDELTLRIEAMDVAVGYNLRLLPNVIATVERDDQGFFIRVAKTQLRRATARLSRIILPLPPL